MGVLKKISIWYFSKAALPYWCVLALDSVIVLFSGYLARYLESGGNGFSSAFWAYSRGLLIIFLISTILMWTERVLVKSLFETVRSGVDTQKIAKVGEYDYDAVCADEERLLAATSSFDNMSIVRIMKEIVPEYKSRESVYEVLDK